MVRSDQIKLKVGTPGPKISVVKVAVVVCSFNKMDPDTEGLLEVASLVVGATVIAGSYALKYFYDITTKRALMTVPQFRNFGPELKSFLSTQPNQSSVILIEGSVQPRDQNELTSRNGTFSGAGCMTLLIANFKSKLENANTLLDVPRTKKDRTSIPFDLSDSYNNVIVVNEIHRSTGFDQLLQLVDDKDISQESKRFDYLLPVLKHFKDNQMTPQEIPFSFKYKKYLLLFGTKFGGFGRAYLQNAPKLSVKERIIKFYPKEVGLSINDLIKSHEDFALRLSWMSKWLFVGGVFVIVFVAVRLIWKFVNRRRAVR